MGGANHIKSQIRQRLDAEIGTIYRNAPESVALVYPSPYFVGMSSLGFQHIYRTIHESGRSAERAFLPEDLVAYRTSRMPLITYESMRPVSDFPVIAMSVAFELELSGVIEVLRLSGIPALASERSKRHPFVLCGGPLSFSNPVVLSPYADAILIGEADETVNQALDILFEARDNDEAKAILAREIPSCYVPDIHGDVIPPPARCDKALLPAVAPIRTPNTELRDMFLIEAERGCHRTCNYCVMRRGSAYGGMRLVPAEKILGLIPEDAKRVGLVGAAVSDHPKIADLVHTIADSGREVGVSSLRPDRLNDRLVSGLKKGGYRTLTTAMDGASQKLRDQMARRAKTKHIERAAQLAREYRMKRLKLYMIVGLPNETDDDIDELITFSRALSKVTPLSLSIAPFVAKRNTPLDRQPFAGIKLVERRLKRLRRGVQGKVDIRSTSARWAWIEWKLSQGTAAEGRAVMEAVDNGGGFRAYEKAFERCGSRRALPVLNA